MKKQIFTLMVGAAIVAMSPAFAMKEEASPHQIAVKTIESHLEEAREFPKPSGPFSIGYQDFELIDESREDPYNSGHDRRLKVTIWYPSEDALTLEPYNVKDPY